MKARICIVIAMFLSAAPVMGQPPATFAAAKRLLSGIHEDIGHLTTVYCSCPYSRKGRTGGDIDRDACSLKARKNDKRSDPRRVGTRCARVMVRT